MIVKIITRKFGVKTYLEHAGLWSCVDNADETSVAAADKYRPDVRARTKIILMIEQCNCIYVPSAKSTKDVWENLSNTFQDSGSTRKLTILITAHFSNDEVGSL